MISTADAVGELELDQLLNQPARLIERRAEQEKAQFENQVDENRLELLRIMPALDRRDDAVDDQFSDPGLRRRQQRAAEGHESQANSSRAVGLPDQPDGRRGVTKRVADFLPFAQQSSDQSWPPKMTGSRRTLHARLPTRRPTQFLRALFFSGRGEGFGQPTAQRRLAIRQGIELGGTVDLLQDTPAVVVFMHGEQNFFDAPRERRRQIGANRNQVSRQLLGVRQNDESSSFWHRGWPGRRY